MDWILVLSHEISRNLIKSLSQIVIFRFAQSMSTYEGRPSQETVVDHQELIVGQAADKKRDEPTEYGVKGVQKP